MCGPLIMPVFAGLSASAQSGGQTQQVPQGPFGAWTQSFFPQMFQQLKASGESPNLNGGVPVAESGPISGVNMMVRRAIGSKGGMGGSISQQSSPTGSAGSGGYAQTNKVGQ